MSLSVSLQPGVAASASPYRLVAGARQSEAGLTWANTFLDALRIRQLSLCSLRAYAYDLLHFARWRQGSTVPLEEITESTLLDYVRHQLEQHPKPAATTVNHRLGTIRCLYQFHYGRAVAVGNGPHLPRTHTKRPSLGYGRARRLTTDALRLKQPRRAVLPLSAEEVARFWKSFHTVRDLAIVGLLLLDGLRSCEVLTLQLRDLNLAEAQIRVLGKGNKPRNLPLPRQVADALQTYLRVERPLTNSPFLFVSLKGKSRGCRMTAAGMRSLFRHHRLSSQVPNANPHRFRHTFGADMVRAGISLPALQHLMGHSNIRITMLYVELAPQDVWREYARALQNRCIS